MADNWKQKPFCIPTFKGFVPHRVRFCTLIIFACCFQLSGGVYLAGLNQMMGGKTLIQEDIMMAAYASFIGLTITFPLLFRVKFRFKSRNIIMTAATTIAVANIIIMTSNNLLVIIAASFVVGMCRLFGTFECMSTLQGKLAPNHDQTIFFCVLFCIILSAIQLSGLATTYIDFYYNWEHMHLFVTFIMLGVALAAFVMMKNIRLTDKLPLYGIDFTGFILWSVFLLSTSYTLLYGKYHEWFYCVNIRVGAVISIVSFLLALRQMFTAEQPYFSPDILSYKKMRIGLLLTMCMIMLLATPTVVESTLTGGILHYHNISAISLNFIVLIGGITGSLIAFYTLIVRRMFYKWIIFWGFACLVAYQGILYFLIDRHTSLEMLYIPCFLRGVGYTMLYVTLTLYSIKDIPFKYFLQPVGILGFVRTGIGTVAVAALVSNLMHFLTKESYTNLCAGADALNNIATGMSHGAIYGEIMQQALMVSLKQILGWFTIGGIAILLIIPGLRYIKPVMRNMPSMRSYRKIVQKIYKVKKIYTADGI